jgi:predicted PhzF superfamily epimerase YddE/YHI9
MPNSLDYVTLDVFTNIRWAGNPLAIVRVALPEAEGTDVAKAGSGIQARTQASQVQLLSQETKQYIAREFNFSETVFLHPTKRSISRSDEEGAMLGIQGNDPVPVYEIDIFTPQEELPFAGHPTVGTSWYIFNQLANESSGTNDNTSPTNKPTQIILQTKAGLILVRQQSFYHLLRTPGSPFPYPGALLKVPQAYKTHHPIPYHHPLAHYIRSSQYNASFPHQAEQPYLFRGGYGMASIVKGMTFIMPQLRFPDEMKRLQPFSQRLDVSHDPNSDWMKWGCQELLAEDGKEWCAEGNLVGVYFWCVDPLTPEELTARHKQMKAGSDAQAQAQAATAADTGPSSTPPVPEFLVRLRTRMFIGPTEDPATGSAASCLAAFLSHRLEVWDNVASLYDSNHQSIVYDNKAVTEATNENDEGGLPKAGKRRYRYEITQGVEMSRTSNITVTVEMEGVKMNSIELAGVAVGTMKGVLDF